MRGEGGGARSLEFQFDLLIVPEFCYPEITISTTSFMLTISGVQTAATPLYKKKRKKKNHFPH